MTDQVQAKPKFGENEYAVGAARADKASVWMAFDGLETARVGSLYRLELVRPLTASEIDALWPRAKGDQK